MTQPPKTLTDLCGVTPEAFAEHLKRPNPDGCDVALPLWMPLRSHQPSQHPHDLMTPEHIATLRRALEVARDTPASFVAYHPDSKTCVEIIAVEPHAQTGELLAIWGDGDGEQWTPLAEASLRDFALVTRLA